MLGELVGKHEVGPTHRGRRQVDEFVVDAALVEGELDPRREGADPVPVQRDVGGHANSGSQPVPASTESTR